MGAINSRWTRAQSYNILCSSSAIKPRHPMVTIKTGDSGALTLIKYANTKLAFWSDFNEFPSIRSSIKKLGSGVLLYCAMKSS